MQKLIKDGLLLLTLCGLISCGGTKPEDLAVANAKLKPCPSSPNCVSTHADRTDQEHYISPIRYKESRQQAKEKLMAVIDEMPRTKLHANQDDYIHVTFTTLVFRFVDDVEFYLPNDARLIHFRSASRIGYADLGKNRRRMKNVKEKFKAK